MPDAAQSDPSLSDPSLSDRALSDRARFDRAPLDTTQPILAIEASSRPASIALSTGSDQIDAPHQLVLDGDRDHASDLVPAIRDLLREHGVEPRALGCVVVGTGPGSYTGLRVAAATALGLRLGADADLVGVPSFGAIARRGLGADESAVVLRDAFGGYLYAGRYRGNGEVVAAPFCAKPDALLESGALGEPIWIIDARGRAAMERSLGEQAPVPQEMRAVEPRATDVLWLAARRPEDGRFGVEGVKPLYLRAFGS